MYLNVAIENDMGFTNAYSHIKYAIQDMVDQLNNRTSNSFNYYGVESPLDVDMAEYGDDAEAEKQYIRDCLEELYNENHAIDGDAWVIADGAEVWGYGRGGIEYKPDSSTTIYGARAFHTPSQTAVADPLEFYHNLAMHEMGHNLTADHNKGDYTEYWDGSEWRIKDVTPMASIYVYTSDDHNDSCWENGKGKSHAPDSLCNGRENKTMSIKFCNHWTCEAVCRHDTLRLASCAVDDIEDSTPL